MPLNAEDLQKQVKIRYEDYRGETSLRVVVPVKIWFGATEWHSEPQWLLEALDVQKRADRSFAVKDINEWISD